MATRKTANAATKVETANVAVENDNKPIIPKDVSSNTIVVVKNGFQGRLVYISPKTGEMFVWENYGDEQEMELGELRNAKGSRKAFYRNNWFMFDEDNAWVVPYLGLGEFYKNAISLDDLDEICKNTPAKLKAIISKLSVGQKRSVQYRAQQLIADGEIDSRKAIAALEEALGVELIEK